MLSYLEISMTVQMLPLQNLQQQQQNSTTTFCSHKRVCRENWNEYQTVLVTQKLIQQYFIF